ncbi:MAG: isoprenylcysteine carboxylmethyltransferase family protein [Chloroflexota bacterium]
MSPLTRQLIRSSVFGTLTLAAMLFIPRGTLDYWQGWTYIAVAIVASGGYTFYLARHDPALLRRRSEAGIGAEREPAQKVIIAALFAVFIALIVVPPLDVRFGWSPVPTGVSVIGDTGIVFSFYVFYLVSKVNTYAAANIRVEPGQRVIDSGVYAWVRHPMYFGALFLLVGTPLALGSWYAVALVPLFMPVLYFRIANEESVLLRDLPGYVEYRQRVRYRLVPYIW